MVESSSHRIIQVCRPRQLDLAVAVAQYAFSTRAPQIDSRPYSDAWSEAEIKALVQFVHFHCDNTTRCKRNIRKKLLLLAHKQKQHYSDRVK